MNTLFRKIVCAAIIAIITILFGCEKKATPQPSPSPSSPSGNSDSYSSMADFFAKNGVAMQSYTINAGTGGSFTTPQGTVVTIPANAFMNGSYHLITGNVTINFKDIYKKSDMLLSNMPTNMVNGAPLKSAGEFFIKAVHGNDTVQLTQKITIKQPFNSLPADTMMKPFVQNNGVFIAGQGWVPADTLATVSRDLSLSDYVFSLYSLQSPVDSGTWCNSDNSYFFSAFPQTSLTLQETDSVSKYNTYVFLVFKGLNSMVHVYNGSGNTFPYAYAPQGLDCTVVAVGVKGGTVYSSFTPITIGSNQTVNFSMSATTTADFEAALAALN
jgi:hypothetical protein